MLKTIMDIVISVTALILLSPVILIIILVMIFMQETPILFKQKRCGKNGEEFYVYKFRTMTQNDTAKEGSFDTGSTLRVTKIGKILRKTKLDELPQLLNVLKGDMSLVGPRPEVRVWVDAYPVEWSEVHKVKPGITDPASILYRHEEDILSQSDDPEKTYREEILPNKLKIYKEYVEQQNIFSDIKIIFKTFIILFK